MKAARLIATLLVLGGCTTGPAAPPVEPTTATGVPVVLRFGDHVATATLTDTPEARQLAAILPATVELRDVWRQAKSGRLPHPLTAANTPPVHDPIPGGIYFWPRSEVLAIYYDDLGQTVPDPGLIRLGTVGTGLPDLAAAGRRFTLRIA